MTDMRSRPDKTSPEEAFHEDAAAAQDERVSRSALRRQALDVLKLAHSLAELSDAQLATVPLSDDLLGEVRRTRAVRQQIARKRQTQYLAKQLRKLDDDALAAIRAALEHDRGLARRDTAMLHQVENWRDRLLGGGDESLGELLAAFPDADRQRLRQLVRQVRAESDSGKPPHAYRELFRILRELMNTSAGS